MIERNEDGDKLFKTIHANKERFTVEAVSQRLRDLGIIKVRVFPGSNPNATDEDVANELNSALDQIEAGEYTEIK